MSSDVSTEADLALIPLDGFPRAQVQPPAYTRSRYKVVVHQHDDGEWLIARGRREENVQTVAWTLDRCLERFAALYEASPEDIRRFADTYGLINLCGHRMERPSLLRVPYPTHLACRKCGDTAAAIDRWWEKITSGRFCPVCDECSQATPLGVWIECARAARAALLIAMCLRRKKATDGAMWVDLAWGESRAASLAEDDEDLQWSMLSLAIQEWLRVGASICYALEPRSDERRPEEGLATPTGGLVIQAHGTFGVITGQLANAVQSTRGWHECEWCGTPFTRLREPKRMSTTPLLCPTHLEQWTKMRKNGTYDRRVPTVRRHRRGPRGAKRVQNGCKTPLNTGRHR